MIRILLTLVIVGCAGRTSAQGNARTDTVWNQRDGQGVMQGYWKKYTPDSILVYKGYFRDGKPLGKFYRYYENGRLKALMDHDPDGIHCYARLYYPNGNLAAEGRYYNQSKDSTWVYYSYYTQAITSTENYLRGEKQGTSYVYYPDGTIAESMEWDRNLAHGSWKQYYKDFSLRLESNMNMGEIDGAYLVYSRTGSLIVKGRYNKGLMDGAWEFYNDDGELEYRLNYKNGTNLDEEEYYRKAMEYQKEIEKNLGTIPEPDSNDFIPGNR
jgi:antitoxin component YwqK of YwqJK toxin-antitoxin module